MSMKLIFLLHITLMEIVNMSKAHNAEQIK